MVTVRDVLDRLGTPPPAEVCLDWTKQLESWSNASEQVSNATPSLSTLQTERSAILADWSSIEVDSKGILSSLAPPSAREVSKPVQVGQLMDQLRAWSQENPKPLNANAAAESRSGEPVRRRDRCPKDVRRPWLLRSPKLMSTCLLGISVVIFTYRQMNPEQAVSSRSEFAAVTNFNSLPNQVSSNGVSVSDESDTTREHSGGWIPSVEDALTLSTSSAESPRPESLPDDVPTVENLLALRTSETDLRPPIDSSNPPPTTAAVPAVDGLEQPASSDNSLAQDITQPLTASQSPAPMLDVLGELSQWSTAAEKQAAEKELVASPQALPSAVGPPLVLATSPAYQRTSLDVTIRARQPACKLRLTVSEGVVLTPVEAQTIQGSEWASWLLSDASVSRQQPQAPQGPAPTPPTQVMVQVQLSPQRQASLRWRIVAGANDFPGVLIPVDSQLLDVVRTRLNHQLQWTALERERLSAIVRTAGMPSETRNMVYAQRRQLDTQRELVTRWLQIVADAHLMHGWLDGQFEVHAAFMDTHLSPPVTLWQSGTP
jgi:hypothetical protein